VGGVHEQDVTDAADGGVEGGLQFGAEERPLDGNVFAQ
jgi:hypothetical protein